MKKKLFLSAFFIFIFFSTGFSQSGWMQLYSGTTVHLKSVHFFDSETGLVVGNGGTMLRTTNGGLNWTTITSGTTGEIMQIQFPVATTGYYLDGLGHLAKTTNSGLNWTFACTFNPQTIQSIFFVDANTGHGGGYWGGYPEGWWLKTTNSGLNWSGACLGQQFLTSVFFPSSLVGYIGTGTNFVGHPELKKTTNSGVTWSDMPIGITNNVTINTVFFLDEYTGWAGLADGRIYKTINGGNNWTYLTFTNYPIYNIQFKNLFTGYFACGSPPGASVFRTRDGGSNWSETLVTSGGPFRWVYFANTLTGYVVGDNGKIFKTTVGGESVPITPKNLNVNAISPSKIVLNWEDKSTNESGFKIFRSTDAGASWFFKDSTGQNTQDYLDTGLISNHEYFYRVCSFNIVGNSFYTPIDWDTTYVSVPPVVTLNYSKITVDKPILSMQTVFDTNIVTLPYIVPVNIRDVEITIDTLIGSNIGALDFILIHQGIYDTIIYHAGGAGNNFIRTTLDDSAMVPIASGTPPFTGRYKPYKPLAQFNNLDPTGLWLLRIYSSSKSLTGVIKSWGITISYNNPSIGIKQISSEIPDRFKLFQNYPNPFNPVTNIKYQITNNGFVSLKIYDILGKEVATPVSEKQEAGEYEVTFGNNGLVSGIYFYTITAGSFTDTKKMLLIK